MASQIPIKLVELNSENPKVYELWAPVGEQEYNPASSKVVGPRRTPWKIPFDVDNPDPETTDELIGIKSGEKPFSYTSSDLDGNFIELSANPSEQFGTDSTNVTFECQGYSGRLSMRLCSYPDPQNPTRTLYNSRVTTIYSTAYVNSYTWQQYRNSSSWNPDNPWGDRWIDPDGNWFNSNAFRAEELTVLNGVRPRISFHVEKFRNPSWTTGRYINCLVINHWFWDTTDAENPVYRIRNQQIIALKYISDAPITPQKPKTPSKTPNSTPEGGRGNRSNISATVPMPGASGLQGFSRYLDGDQAGIHLYKISAEPWAELEGQLWNDDLLAKTVQAVSRGGFGVVPSGGKKGLDQYIISAVRIGLPINPNLLGTYSISVGKYTFSGTAGESEPAILGKIIQSRYVDTDVWEFNIPYYSETFLDFDPMTKIQIHIPYCGVASISPDSCMGGKLQVKYIVDLISADCTAIVRAIDQFGNTTIPATLSGKCGVQIPFITNELNQDKIASSIFSIAVGALSGNIGGVAKGAGGLVSASNDLMDSTKVGNCSTTGGLSAILGDRALYVAIYHPQDMTGLKLQDLQQVDGFGNKVGYAAASFAPLSSFADNEYVEALINPNSIQTATDAEKEAIRNELQRGVYI